MRASKIDLIIILVWPIIASILSLVFKVNFLVATILYLVLPSIYLSLKLPSFVKKSLIFSTAAMPMLFVMEYLAVKSGAWYFTHSIFSTRLFDTIIYDALLWYFAWVYLVVIFYEAFLDKHCTPKLYSPKLKHMVMGFMAAFILVLILALKNIPVEIPYFYLVLGITMVLMPILVVLFRFPVLFDRIMKGTMYFAYLYLLLDLTEIALGHWYYPGQFIGWVDFFGLRIPMEEFIFWIMFGGATVISWYTYFDEDKKVN